MDANKIKELPVGEYDAVRTLRHALQHAEQGKIKNVIIICADGLSKEECEARGTAADMWASWSDMTREQILWLTRWFNSWINMRYFGMYHVMDEDDG